LLNSHQPQHVPSDDRERMTSARQAAEALFAPKKQLTEQPVPDSMPPLELSARKPRILRALPPPPACLEQGEKPADGRATRQTSRGSRAPRAPSEFPVIFRLRIWFPVSEDTNSRLFDLSEPGSQFLNSMK
jgi:hypothetical protein